MRLTFLVVATLVVAPVVAQGDGDAQAEYDKLTAEVKAAQKEYRAKRGAITKTEEYQKALAEKNRELCRKLTSKVPRVDMAAFAARFQAGADKHAGSDGAVPFLIWLTSSSRQLGPAAAGTLVSQHVGSEKIGDFVDSLPRLTRNLGQDKVRQMIDTVIEKSPHKLIKAHAYYARSNMYRAPRGETLSAEDAKARQAALTMVSKLAPGSLVALKAEGPVFQKEHLQIGMTAPDIEGKDLDGVSFKLSDYRGKVVVIDFWGDW